MAVGDDGSDITFHWLSSIETATIELVDVSILNLPDDIARIVSTT